MSTMYFISWASGSKSPNRVRIVRRPTLRRARDVDFDTPSFSRARLGAERSTPPIRRSGVALRLPLGGPRVVPLARRGRVPRLVQLLQLLDAQIPPGRRRGRGGREDSIGFDERRLA